jgi:hypothetical protein
VKAVVMNEYGGPEVLKSADYPEPRPGPGVAYCHQGDRIGGNPIASPGDSWFLKK